MQLVDLLFNYVSMIRKSNPLQIDYTTLGERAIPTLQSPMMHAMYPGYI